MDTRLLRYFVAVVDAGTVSAAADHLHMTQPSLSRQIRQLEAELKLSLFFRQAGRLRLTSEGRQFYTTATKLLQHHHEAAEYAALLAQGRMATVSLGAPTTTLTDIVAPFVATFHAQDPVPSVSEVGIDADLGLSLSIFDMVVGPVRWPATTQTLHLVELPVWAYVPDKHRWARRRSVDLTQLAEETLILPTTGFKARRVLEAALDEAQLAPPTTVETRHGQVAQALAAAGRGAAVVTDDARYGLHPLRIQHRGHPLLIHLYAAWRPDHYAAASVSELAARLRAFCQARYPQ